MLLLLLLWFSLFFNIWLLLFHHVCSCAIYDLCVYRHFNNSRCLCVKRVTGNQKMCWMSLWSSLLMSSLLCMLFCVRLFFSLFNAFFCDVLCSTTFYCWPYFVLTSSFFPIRKINFRPFGRFSVLNLDECLMLGRHTIWIIHRFSTHKQMKEAKWTTQSHHLWCDNKFHDLQ